MSDQKTPSELNGARVRWLAWSQVYAALQEIGLPTKSGPHGFAIGHGCRLQIGSGIAGRGHEWAIVEVRSGMRWADMPRVSTLRDLRWWLRAFMTGEPPPSLVPGFIFYPRLNHNRFGDSWIWVRRSAA